MNKPSLAPLRGQLTLFLITRIILDTGFLLTNIGNESIVIGGRDSLLSFDPRN
jgi:hypothetical protein